MASGDAGMGYYAPKISDRESTGFDYFEKEVVENNFQRKQRGDLNAYLNVTFIYFITSLYFIGVSRTFLCLKQHTFKMFVY